MKIKILIFTAILFFSTAELIKSQIVLAPGDEKTFTTGSATSGQAGNNGNVTFNVLSDYDPAAKTIKALSDGSPTSFGTGEAFALINYDFQISQSSGTEDNTVGAWISYDVSWQGFQLMLAIALSNSNVKIDMTLRDLTDSENIYNDIIHDLDLKTHSIKFVSIGVDFNDTGNKINTFPAVLKRGHSYRLTLKLTATLQKYLLTAAEASSCNYYTSNRGAELNYLYIKVGLDEKETLQKLAQIDSLESRIDTLEYRLENHYHTYLTGRGVGHNNTEASTTLSIFEAYGNSGTTPPVFDAYPVQTPEEGAQNKSLPDDYSVGQNFPNPFNPITKISFAIPEQEFVSVKVFDILGRQIEVLINENKAPGYYAINFNGDKLPSGTYIYEIRAGSFVETKKMILLK